MVEALLLGRNAWKKRERTWTHSKSFRTPKGGRSTSNIELNREPLPGTEMTVEVLLDVFQKFRPPEDGADVNIALMNFAAEKRARSREMTHGVSPQVAAFVRSRQPVLLKSLLLSGLHI